MRTWGSDVLEEKERAMDVIKGYVEVNDDVKNETIGPLLFILYINYMNNVSKNIFPILFADDTTVLIEGNNLDVINTSLNSELDRINTWLKSNNVSLNVTKTHYMVFYRARRKVSHNKLFINNSMVTQVSCSKFLGIIL